MGTEVTGKKREILPVLSEAIMALTMLSADAATLELHDNEQASKRLRQGVIDFKNKNLKVLEVTVQNMRFDINTKKGRSIKRPRKELKITDK